MSGTLDRDQGYSLLRRSTRHCKDETKLIVFDDERLRPVAMTALLPKLGIGI